MPAAVLRALANGSSPAAIISSRMPLEAGDRQIDLAAHFEHFAARPCRAAAAARCAAVLQIVGDVVARLAVAARGADLEAGHPRSAG